MSNNSNGNGWTITSTNGGWITYTIGGSGGGGFAGVDVAKKTISKDGCSCKKCKEFYPYAEPNQDDGTLICYQCRMVW